MVFATINLKQNKVTKSLAYDLYEFSKSRSPQKTCHNIAKLLNYKEGSPFRYKIKILGVATGKPQESITQATLVDRLIKYVSRKPMQDRDLIKRGKKPVRASGKDKEKYIFRNLWIDERDAEIAKNMWNYFNAVSKKWPKAWPETVRGNILNRTTGYGALMRFLRDIYINFGKPDSVLREKEYYSVIENIILRDNDFTPENFKPGSSGEGELYRTFLEQSRINSDNS